MFFGAPSVQRQPDWVARKFGSTPAWLSAPQVWFSRSLLQRKLAQRQLAQCKPASDPRS